jgi:hypothetical protein
MTGPFHGRRRGEGDRLPILLPHRIRRLDQFANRVDHRGKHQAPGWRHDLAPDGTLTVTTPSGLTAITEPPPY